MSKTRSAYIAIIGRPNVGKSTLLNALLGQKVSITTKKPQTTRHKILGIKTEGQDQFVFVDTPGMHKDPKHKINKLMIKAAIDAIHDVDMIIFMVNSYNWTEDDELILKRLAKVNLPIIMVVNKIDQIKEKDKLLPAVQNINDNLAANAVKPVATFLISAKTGNGVKDLQQTLSKLLPESPHFFPPDQVTDRNERFLVAELIREKLMRVLGEEVPHALTVEIESFKEEEKINRISAIIWVERKGQKLIIIGKKGERLKEIGRLARLDMERQFDKKVFLQLWVKVKSGWTDDSRALRSLGYGG